MKKVLGAPKAETAAGTALEQSLPQLHELNKALKLLKAQLPGFNIKKYLDAVASEALFEEPLGPTAKCLSPDDLDKMVGEKMALQYGAHLKSCKECRDNLQAHRKLCDKSDGWRDRITGSLGEAQELPGKMDEQDVMSPPAVGKKGGTVRAEVVDLASVRAKKSAAGKAERGSLAQKAALAKAAPVVGAPARKAAAATASRPSMRGKEVGAEKEGRVSASGGKKTSGAKSIGARAPGPTTAAKSVRPGSVSKKTTGK